MDLQDALGQIAEIRHRVARSERFCGYRAVPVAFSGLVAFVAAGLQALLLNDPLEQIGNYLTLWVGAAALSLVATAWGMAESLRRSSCPLRRQKAAAAVGQFAPCLLAGALVTFVLARYALEALCALPGLWAVFFGLGVFASRPLLPSGVLGVGCWYLASGVLCLATAQDEWALSPWAMAVPFGVGQLWAAAVLYRDVEAANEQE